MTDINELTEKLKAAAQEEIMCREACDTSDLWQDEASPENVLALTEALEAAEKRIDDLTAERDALREGEMGDAKHSNTRAAADIYFQLVEECDIPAGGSLVQFVDDMKERIVSLEARKLTVKLPKRRTHEDYVDARFSNADLAAIYNATVTSYTRLIEAACDETGIKLQIEGE